MTASCDDHVEWLRREGGRLRKGAESVEDEGKRAKVVARAERMFGIADALQLARAGVLNAEASGGFRAAAELLRPGAVARVHFTSERKMDVVVVAIGRYDVVGRTGGGKTVMIPKHAVLFYEFLGEAADE